MNKRLSRITIFSAEGVYKRLIEKATNDFQSLWPIRKLSIDKFWEQFKPRELEGFGFDYRQEN